MIILCRECNKPMVNILHYEKDKSYAYSFCKTCYYSTKPKKIIYEDVKEYKEYKETKKDKKKPNIKKGKKSKDIKKPMKKSKGRKFKWS